MTSQYLLEIGVEELPARFINIALDQLYSKAAALLKEHQVEYNEIKVDATPRRLILQVNEIRESINEKAKKVKGPAKKIAYDQNGNPTKALLGFLKGQKACIEDVYVENLKDIPYIHVNVVEKNKPLEEIIRDEMPHLIKSITFPKSMKWGGKNIRFARPIRWIVSMKDSEILPFELEGIPVSNVTRGHRFLGSSYIELNHVSEYEAKLKENGVLIHSKERKEIILFHSERLAKEVGGNLVSDEGLIDEIVNIVEFPTPIRGSISQEFLVLPDKVVTTPMKEHLRYLPVYDDKQRLLPYFITVRNGGEKGLESVIKGNEKVLTARLADAKFFYEDDIKQPLEAYAEELKDIIFHEKLGTLWDKTNRLRLLAGQIGEQLSVGHETEQNIERAANLSKADLVTKMVTEFTELQGSMGRDYALKSGETEIVAQAIEEQYLPRFSGDGLPETTAGTVLSLADKLDTIVGLFCIGISPSGSQDPFAQRRAALGIIHILLNKKLQLSLEELVNHAMYGYLEVNGLVFDNKEVKKEVIEFFKGRLQALLLDNQIRHDVVEATLNTEEDRLLVLYDRAMSLNSWISDSKQQKFLESFNRIGNLVKDHDSIDFNGDLLIDEETEIYEMLVNIEERVNDYFDSCEYVKGFEVISQLTPVISNYFDKVMVMDENLEIRQNRLSFLNRIYQLAARIIHLEDIVVKS